MIDNMRGRHRIQLESWNNERETIYTYLSISDVLPKLSRDIKLYIVFFFLLFYDRR